MTDIITINAKGLVPNHLNDTNIFCRYSNNSIIDVEPKELHFSGYKINEKNYQEIKFTNISDEICRFHIIPPVSKYFRLQYKKPERMVPGFFVKCIVIFSPDKVRNYNDFIKIHTKDSENNIAVPVYAYPAIEGLVVPRNIKFPTTAIGKISKRQISLHSDSDMDFDFEIVVTNDHPSIGIDPLHGVIPARGDKVISLQFAPTMYVTCEKTINIYVNQYNFKPIICSIFGTSQPGFDRKPVLESMEKESAGSSNLLSIVKLESKRRSIAPQGSMTMTSDKFADNVINSQKTKQQLRASFESRLLDNVNNERQNQLRWQTCRGSAAMKDEERDLVKGQREVALREYKLKIRDESTLFSCYQNNNVVNDNWTKTICLESGELCHDEDIQTPQYVPECWTVRKSALDKLRSAAWRIITNARLIKRFRTLKESGGQFCEVDTSHMYPGGENLSFRRELDGLTDERIPKQRLTFDNHFNMSEYKLTLPLQPRYEFENLTVPLQMQLLGYERIDNTTLSYFPQQPVHAFKMAPVVDATSSIDEQSQVSPITFSEGRCSNHSAHDDRDRTSISFWPSCSYYDKHSFFPLYYYKNELLVAKDQVEMEWSVPKSAFLVSKKAVRSVTSDNLITDALHSYLLPIEIPGLMTKEHLKDLDYQEHSLEGPTINRSIMLDEFPVLGTLGDNCKRATN